MNTKTYNEPKCCTDQLVITCVVALNCALVVYGFWPKKKSCIMARNNLTSLYLFVVAFVWRQPNEILLYATPAMRTCNGKPEQIFGQHLRMLCNVLCKMPLVSREYGVLYCISALELAKIAIVTKPN